jgi:hypothetical protein
MYIKIYYINFDVLSDETPFLKVEKYLSFFKMDKKNVQNENMKNLL